MPASIKHLTDKKINLTSLLARWKDGLYYTAAIVNCDKTNKRCLVCFEDGSEIWVNNRDVHIQLTLDQLNEDEDIVCCICDDGNSEAPNEIILCDVCQQGYHQKCHNPPVDSSKIDDSEDNSDHKDWFCATCSYILNQSNRAKLSATAQQQQQLEHQNKEKSSSQEHKQQQQQQPKPSKAQQSQRQQHQQAPQSPQKQPVKVKHTAQTPQQSPQKSTVGPIKTQVNPVQKPAPYYPLTSPARVVATSSTAALASMTASSALVVGSSAGRTKQDLVNQSNRSSQRQRQHQSGVNSAISTSIVSTPANISTPVAFADVIVPPVKHAVRKSSMNFVGPIRQSALPTATRSALPTAVILPPAAKLPPHLIATSIMPTTTIVGQSVASTITTSAIATSISTQQVPPKSSLVNPNSSIDNQKVGSSSIDTNKVKQIVIASTTSNSTSITPPVINKAATSVKFGSSTKDPSAAVVCGVATPTTNNSSTSTQPNNSNSKAPSTITLTGSNNTPNSSSSPSPSGASTTNSLRNANAESAKTTQPTVIMSANQVGQKST